MIFKGKCICPSHFTGFSCETFSGNILATLKNVYNGKYLAVDSTNNVIFFFSYSFYILILDYIYQHLIQLEYNNR